MNSPLPAPVATTSFTSFTSAPASATAFRNSLSDVPFWSKPPRSIAIAATFPSFRTTTLIVFAPMSIPAVITFSRLQLLHSERFHERVNPGHCPGLVELPPIAHVPLESHHGESRLPYPEAVLGDPEAEALPAPVVVQDDSVQLPLRRYPDHHLCFQGWVEGVVPVRLG